MNNLIGKPLFHGSRANFDRFDHAYVHTGEGAGVGHGFYFIRSLRGAAHHATGHVRNGHEPMIYAIRLKQGTKVLNASSPISAHPIELQEMWDKKMPFNCSEMVNDKMWFPNLSWKKHHEIPKNKQTKDVVKILEKTGFDVIDNIEMGMTDNCYHGSSLLVLNENCIEIIEKHPIRALADELFKEPDQFVWASLQAPFGKTMSFLRRI